MNVPDIPWLLRKATNATSDVALILTPVDGKVFECQRRVKTQKELKRQVKNPEQVLSEDLAQKAAKEEKKARAAAKAAARGKAKTKPTKASANANLTIAEDVAKESEEVTLHGADGVSLARSKLFADCLVLCLRSATLAARRQHGYPHNQDPSELQCDPDSGEPMKYSEMEAELLKQHLRSGLIFALQGTSMIDGKQHKRWSTMRPALQAHFIKTYEQARTTTTLQYYHCAMRLNQTVVSLQIVMQVQ